MVYIPSYYTDFIGAGDKTTPCKVESPTLHNRVVTRCSDCQKAILAPAGVTKRLLKGAWVTLHFLRIKIDAGLNSGIGKNRYQNFAPDRIARIIGFLIAGFPLSGFPVVPLLAAPIVRFLGSPVGVGLLPGLFVAPPLGLVVCPLFWVEDLIYNVIPKF